MKKKIYPGALALVLSAFLLLILLPAEAAEGARKGLSVCAGVIVPSLFPFLTLSGLLSALGLPSILAKFCGPFLHKLGISSYAATPLLLGLTGGYPVGAAAVAQLLKDGSLSVQDAERILPWCNNTGPAFIIGAAGAAVFGSGYLGLVLYLCHILAALILAIVFSGKKVTEKYIPAKAASAASFTEVFPDCVRNAGATTINICAFVVFFSVLTALLRAIGIFSSLSAFISLRLGTELQFASALLTGLLELGSGIACMTGMSPTPANLALAAFLLGFGGLSVHCQTLSVLSGTGIRCYRHFVGRICHGLISALLANILFTLLQI